MIHITSVKNLSAPIECPNCKHQNPSGSRFCNYCARALTSDLSGLVDCPKCDRQNPAGTRLCSYCGYPLDYAQPSRPFPLSARSPLAQQTPLPPSQEYSNKAYGYESDKQIDRTKTGLFLLLIGIVIEVIPIVGIIGLLLAAIGVIMIILGRQAFGDRHTIFVGIAVALYFFGLISILILLSSITSALSSAIATSNPDPNSLAQAVGGVFNNFLTGGIIIAIIAGLDNVLITYELQARKGRWLLWVGYVASILVPVALFLIVSPQVPVEARQSLASGSYDPAPAAALRAEIQGLGLFNIIPALVFAAAYYLAVDRIDKGEIPKRESPTLSTTSQIPPEDSKNSQLLYFSDAVENFLRPLIFLRKIAPSAISEHHALRRRG